MKISIIIPAYNEEKRITATLRAYDHFFNQKKNENGLEYELLVVINGTTDSTPSIVKNLQEQMPHLLMIEIVKGGKGLAIREGFKNALLRDNNYIGFVDADMATSPAVFYQLIEELDNADGIIASRYMPGSMVTPPRPWIKRWGSKLFYDSLTSLLFGLRYYDTQCGAKLFKAKVIKMIAPQLTVDHWGFDVEILYLCKKYGFNIKEIPTVWHDQAGSKLRMFHAGVRMIGSLCGLRWHHWNKKN